MFGNLLIGAIVFPILRGRLLKKEIRFRKRVTKGFPILRGRLLKTEPKFQKKY